MVFRGHGSEVRAVAFSPDNRLLVTGSDDRTAQLWRLEDRDPTSSSIVLRGHEDSVAALAIRPDGRWLVTGSEDKTARRGSGI